MLNYLGRQVIYSDEEVITRDNLVSVLTNAMNLHAQNSADISYLYNYYKGYQPILDRVKEHSTICNHIVENRAYEIVSFKTGYLLGEPIQYVNRSGDESMNDPIERFNRFMVAENKDAKVQNGALADVAPSILHIMGLEQPAEMTGQCLIVASL